MNAAACFAFVVIYLYASAIPRYHHPVFESGVDFADPLRWPTVAFISDDAVDQGLISISLIKCLIWDSTTISIYPRGALSQPKSIIPDKHGFVFNPSSLNPDNQTVFNLAVEILISVQIECKLLVPSRVHSFASSEFQITPRTVRQAGPYTPPIPA